MNITVMGAGKWGSTLALLYANKFKDESVKLWVYPKSKVRDVNLADYIQKNRRHLRNFQVYVFLTILWLHLTWNQLSKMLTL